MAVAVDRDGNSYVTGMVRDTATFGAGERREVAISGPAPGLGTAFLAKYHKSGVLLGARQIADVEPRSVVVDECGNSYVVGSGNVRSTFGRGDPQETTLVSVPGLASGFLAKFAPGGELLFASLGGGNDVAIDHRAGIYITGAVQAPSGGPGRTSPTTITFGSGEANETTVTPRGADIFLMKYDQRREVCGP